MFMNFWFDSKNFGLPGNRAFYKNDKVDELIRKALELSDQKERIKLYKEAQKIILGEPPYIFLYQTQTIVPMRNWVKGYVFNMLESMYNFESISKNSHFLISPVGSPRRGGGDWIPLVSMFIQEIPTFYKNLMRILRYALRRLLPSFLCW
jgi:hypothetical protein